MWSNKAVTLKGGGGLPVYLRFVRKAATRHDGAIFSAHRALVCRFSVLGNDTRHAGGDFGVAGEEGGVMYGKVFLFLSRIQ